MKVYQGYYDVDMHPMVGRYVKEENLMGLKEGADEYGLVGLGSLFWALEQRIQSIKQNKTKRNKQ